MCKVAYVELAPTKGKRNPIPAVRAAYRDQQEAQNGRFLEDMKAHGWTAVCDLFGAINFWQHGRSGRVVQHEDALAYYNMTRLTPVPF